jgi:hypothetical protein
MLLACRLLAPALYPQPLFWLLGKRMLADQEAVADAETASDVGPVSYAEHLVAWARAAVGNRAVGATAVLAAARSSSVSERVRRILSGRPVERSCPRKWAVAVCGLAALFTGATSSLTLQAAPPRRTPQPQAIDRWVDQAHSPSPGTPGEGRGEGFLAQPVGKDPHPDPLPEYREREKEPLPRFYYRAASKPAAAAGAAIGAQAVNAGHPSYPFPPGGKIRIVTSDGDVRLATWEADAVGVDVSAPEGVAPGSRANDFDVSATTELLEVKQRAPSGRPGKVVCTLHVPRGVRVERASTQSGNITISGTFASLNATTITGGIDVDDIGGDAVLRSDSGPLRVRLPPSRNGHTLRAHTDHGTLTLCMPRTAAYTLSAQSEDGTIEDGFGPAHIYGHNISLNRSAGDGKAGTLELSTRSGPLVIRPIDTPDPAE